ncbi:MAG: hypothetical protein ACR2HF_16025 [Methylococcaceae bacterium]
MTQNETKPHLPEMQTEYEVASDQKTSLQRMIDAVNDYINSTGWHPGEQIPRKDGGITFALQFNMDNGHLRVFMEVYGDGDRFAIYAYPVISIPEEHRLSVALYATYVNHAMLLGKLQLDMEDGELRMCNSIDVDSSFLSQNMLIVMERLTIMGMDNHMEFILGILYGGRSPEEAYKAYCDKHVK